MTGPGRPGPAAQGLNMARLAAARRRAGLTQRELAARAGLTGTGQLCRYARGRQPNARRLAALAQALGVSADYLLGRRPGSAVLPELELACQELSRAEQRQAVGLLRLLLKRRGRPA